MSFNQQTEKWIAAFWRVLCGPPTSVGDGFKWKQAVLSLAITWTISSPFFTFYLALPYQGDTPPKAPLMKFNGKLKFEHQGVKSTLIARIAIERGASLTIQDPAGLLKVREWERKSNLEDVYVEGFLLRDGAGLLWPTYVATQGGEVLLSKSEQLEKLKVARNPFGKVLLFMYVISVPMWLVSFNNIRKVKTLIGV
ncbi:hypothetical protein J2794_006420 [Paraburkholderia terricola]|uniref:hypothetical protein n=1 Tax=Paraburkholderia terricola TaxID=169427 RepID=UPI002863F208|nr:hypothetical protein [Paraburkholderia terricola]MDR6450279.1 hypothetical protein [Paraburkholderia terricola]